MLGDELRFFDRIVGCGGYFLADVCGKVYLVLCYVVDECVGVVLACKTVGVFAFGQAHHVYVHAFGEGYADGGVGVFFAGGVGVVHQYDVRREPMQQVCLCLFQAAAARAGHYVGHAALVHRYDVGLSFDYIDAVGFGDGVFGLEDAE